MEDIKIRKKTELRGWKGGMKKRIGKKGKEIGHSLKPKVGYMHAKNVMDIYLLLDYFIHFILYLSLIFKTIRIATT